MLPSLTFSWPKMEFSFAIVFDSFTFLLIHSISYLSYSKTFLLKFLFGCDVGCRCGWDLALLWLWWLQLRFHPQPENLHLPQMQP